MAYSDEWWKGKYGQVRSGGPEYDPFLHGVCGYATAAHPDAMQPRAVYYALQSLWQPARIYLPLVSKDKE